MAGVILLSGIHGVGKSTVAEKLSKRFLIPNYTASKIIKKMKNQNSSDSSKLVSNIDDNQKLLVKGIDNILSENNSFILDGHCTLLNADSKIEAINVMVFKQLSIKGILLLQAFPEEIYTRLMNRDGHSIKLESIRQHQLAEESHAIYVSKQLNIPFKKLLNYTDNELFITFGSLQSLINNR